VKRTTFAMMLMVAASVTPGCKCRNSEEAIPVDDSPVVRSTIAEKAPKGCGSYSYHYGKALQTLREAEEYKAGLRDYYVSELNDRRNEFLLAGISPKFRKDWFDSHRTQEKDLHCMTGIFDELAAAAKRTLPKYKPRGYTHHDSDEEALILEAVKAELPDVDDLQIGVKSPSWMIEKRSNGIPDSRYKYGMAWIKSASHDDGYCRIAYVNIVQDYAGGESYGDSMANYISMEPAGCK
jgi:hypothetical protein